MTENLGFAFDKAKFNFSMALGVDQNNASAYNGLGSLHLLRRDYDQAIEHCRRAIELTPNYLFAHFDLAQSYYFKAWLRTTSIDEMQTLLQEFLRSYEIVIQLHDSPSNGRLPQGARQQIGDMAESIAVIDEQETPLTIDLVKVANRLLRDNRLEAADELTARMITHGRNVATAEKIREHASARLDQEDEMRTDDVLVIHNRGIAQPDVRRL